MAAAPARTLDREVKRSFHVMLACTAVMLTLVATALGWFLLMNNPTSSREETVVRDIESSHAAMIDEETALRAYVSTGDSSLLTPYNAAFPVVTAADFRLIQYVRGSALVADLLDMRLAQDRWTQDWAARARSGAGHRAVVGPDGRLDATKLAGFFQIGEREFDAYRAADARLLQDARDRFSSARRQAETVLAATWVSLCLVAAVTVLITVRRRRDLQANVVGPVRSLLAVVHDVARGEFGSAPDVAGPAEVVELRDGLAEMISSLAVQQRALSARADESAQMTSRLRHVLRFAREVSGSLTLRYVLEALASATTTTTGAPRVRIWLLDEDSARLTLGFDTLVDRKATVPDLTRPLGVGAIGRAAQYGDVRYSRHTDNLTRGDIDTDVDTDVDAGIVAQPLIVGARVIGVVEAVLPDGQGQLGEESLEVLETIAGHAATAVEAARLHQRTELLSVSDALTGLANRRRLDEDLEMELERALRYGRPLTLVMLDVDHFKAVNDTHGHARGDAVLQEIAGVLRDQMRTCDSVYRYGGEEFVVLARETDADGGTVLAERLRESVERRFARVTGGRMTISLGVAAVPLHASSSVVLVEAADTALYAAKRAGRNRIVVAGATGASDSSSRPEARPR